MSRPFVTALALASLSPCALAQDARPPGDELRAQPAPEWEALFQRTEGWTGGDGAASVVLGDRVLWLFADSWIGPVADGKHGPGSTIVRNAIAIHPLPKRWTGKAPEPSEVWFYWGAPDADGKPTAWAKAPREGEWLWPAGGAVSNVRQGNRRLVIFYSRLGTRDAAANDMWNFEGRGTVVGTIDDAHRPVDEWRISVTELPDSHTGRAGPAPRRQVAWGSAALLGDHVAETIWIHVFGIDASEALNKRLVIATTGIEMAQEASTWSFFCREGWSKELRDLKPAADNLPDEFSVTVHGFMGRSVWVLIYSEPLLGSRILARSAEKPEGPWSDPVPIYACPEPARDKRLFVYGAKAHPELSKDGELLVSYCVNSHDFWHMAANAEIYRPRFIRVPLALIEKAVPATEGAPAPP